VKGDVFKFCRNQMTNIGPILHIGETLAEAQKKCTIKSPPLQVLRSAGGPATVVPHTVIPASFLNGVECQFPSRQYRGLAAGSGSPPCFLRSAAC